MAQDAALRERNWIACAGGSPASCNEKLLTPEQASEIRQAASRRNLMACLSGFGYQCNEKALTSEQAAQVREAALRRNVGACTSGMASECNEKLLTPQQAEEVKTSALRRNFTACAIGMDVGCNEELLTAEQAAEVHEAALRRNYAACVAGAGLQCNQKLLTPEQAEEVRSATAKVAEMTANIRSVSREETEIARWRGLSAASMECDPIPQAEVTPIIDAAARANRLEQQLIRKVMEQESGYYPCAVSPKGALGLMQLMPATAEQFGVMDPFDAKQNVEAGARFLKQLMDRYNGNLSLALAAYNAGPGSVDQAGGIPDIKETQDYVRSVMNRIR